MLTNQKPTLIGIKQKGKYLFIELTSSGIGMVYVSPESQIMSSGLSDSLLLAWTRHEPRNFRSISEAQVQNQ